MNWLKIDQKETREMKTKSLMRCKRLLMIFAIFSASIFTFIPVGAQAISNSTRLKAPENLFVKQMNTEGLELTWKKVDGAKGYEVFKARPNLGGYRKVKTVKSTVYKDKKVRLGKSGTYKVRAYKTNKGKKIYSKFSYPVSAKVCKKTDKRQNAANPELVLDADTKELVLGIGESINKEYEQFFTTARGPKKKNGKGRYKPLNSRLRWYSTNPSVVKVKSGTDIKAGNKPGKAYIYVIAHNGKKSNKIPVIVKDYAYEKVDIKYAPGEVQVLFNLCEQQIRDVCSYYTTHNNMKAGEYYRLRYDGDTYSEGGNAPIPDERKLPIIKEILEESPYLYTEIMITESHVDFTVYEFPVNESHLIFYFFRSKSREDSTYKLGKTWYYHKTLYI